MSNKPKYVMNIKTGTIHLNDGSCNRAQKIKEANRKYFVHLEDALNYYEGEKEKGKPCGICNPF